MKRWRFAVIALAGILAGSRTSALAAPQPPAPRLIAHYPLTQELTDATGNNPPMLAVGAPIVPTRGIFCNGLSRGRSAGGCDVRTPALKELDLSAFTISAQFFMSRQRTPRNPVFGGGQPYSWLWVDLQLGGVVRLGYNSTRYQDCSVKYHLGVWHEATITFDGRTAALDLDGVRGCSVDIAALDTGGQRVVSLTHSGNATVFYGVLRELKVHNGVAIPARRTPTTDSFEEPPAPNLAPVDLVLMRCPSRQEIASIDADLRLSFDADPTKDEPRACSAADGSRDLSPLRKRVYNVLLLMKQLQFDRPLPWTKEPLYRWFTHAVDGIRFRSDVANSSCCGPGRAITIAVRNQAVLFTDRWSEPALGGGLDTFLLLLAHEARHGDGYPHTCGTRDQTLEEMGSYGVQYLLARWLADYADQPFFTSGTIRYTERLTRMADQLRKGSFCK